MPETRTLMLYRQISHCTVWEQNRTQTLSIGRIYELSKVKTAGTYSNHWALKNIIDHQVTKKHGTVEAYLHALLTLAPLRSSLSTVPTGYNRPASSAVVKTSHVIPPFPPYPFRACIGRPSMKCDGTHAEIRFRLSAKRTSPFKSAEGRQFSRLLAAEVCASAVVMLNTPCSEVVWRVLATHSIRQFPLQFRTRASPCATTFQLHVCSQWPGREKGQQTGSLHHRQYTDITPPRCGSNTYSSAVQTIAQSVYQPRYHGFDTLYTLTTKTCPS